MVKPRSDRHLLLRVTFGFAIASTTAWVVLVATHSESAIAGVIWTVYGVLNFGGDIVSMFLQVFLSGGLSMIFGPPHPDSAMDLLGWAWWVGTEFAGALIQGLVYGWLAVLITRNREGRHHWTLKRALGLMLTGPASYTAWQLTLGLTEPTYSVAVVAVLVVLLLGIGITAGWLARGVGEGLLACASAVAGISTACWTDWSDDTTGLFVIGWFMVTVGAIGAALVVIMGTGAVRAARRVNSRGAGAGSTTMPPTS